MGTFSGHVMPGICFLLYGLRWTYCIFYRYFLCRREQALAHGRSRRFHSTLTFPFSCCPGFPLEAAGLLTVVSLIMIFEASAVFRRGYLEVGQHLTMYFFYGAAAFIMILKHYRYPVIPGSDYVSLVLSFVVNTFLMQRHIAGKSTLEVQVHQNSMLVMMVAAVVLCLEMKYRHNPMLPLIRAFCFCLNGSWLIMEDFILYSPWGKWPNEDPKWIMIATISFGGQVATIFQFFGTISYVALRRVRSLSPAEVSIALDVDGLNQRGDLNRKISSNCEQSEYLLVQSDDEV